MDLYDEIGFYLRYYIACCRLFFKLHWFEVLFFGTIVGLIFGAGYWSGSC